MSPPDLLSSNPSSFSRRLKSQFDQTLATIIRTNHSTKFVQVAPKLIAFRDAIAGRVDGMDDTTLCDAFRQTVQLTTYDTYAPLISRFFEKPCRVDQVIDLLSPGLPDYLVRSSSTSGGIPKAFPKYNRLPDMSASAPLSDQVPKRTSASIFSFIRDSLDVSDEHDHLVKTVHVTFTVSSVTSRLVLGLHPDRDEERMTTFISDFAAPYAAGFIKKWRSFLLIHGLFALGSRSLENMRMSFITTFVELMHHINEGFDMVVESIANGTIPDIDGITEVRKYLESTISPDPERAAELRRIGRPTSRPGWCNFAWPNLRSIACTASGSFSSSLPLAQSFLGPNIRVLARMYGGTEGQVGRPYDPLYLEYYKLNNDVVTEFWNFNEGESSSSIMPPWEVELGKHYEVVMTRVHGLWRYRLGDVVEIAGFDPTDGTPVVRFIERRDVAVRFAHFMVSEKDLISVMMLVAESTLGNVVDWTAIMDKRQVPHTIGFFVELAGEEVPDASLAGERILDAFSHTNIMVPRAFAKGSLGKPTVRVVERGAFSAFRQLRLDEGCSNVGQIKVPVVLPKPTYVAWFTERVVKEL